MSEKTITWLHLSDLHTCVPKTGWDSYRVLETLEDDLRFLESYYSLHPDFIFFTGDAAFGHLPTQGFNIADQFKDAENFFAHIRKVFTPAIPKDRFFIVPGNHDIDRSMVTDDQIQWLMTQGNQDAITAMMHSGNRQWQRAMERLNPYKEFLEREEYFHLLSDSKRLIFTNKVDISGVTVGIAGFNSAWSCCRDKEKGALWLGGSWQESNLHRDLTSTQLSIALMHHPVNWFVEQEDPNLGRKIERDFTFFLHGHEHQGWVDAKADGHVRVAAAACYDRSDQENGYNFVRIDLENKKGEVFLRRFDSEGGGWIQRNIHGRTNRDGIWELSNLRILKPESISTSDVKGFEDPIVVKENSKSNEVLSIEFTFNFPIKDFDTNRLLKFLENEMNVNLSKVEITKIWQGSTNLRLEGDTDTLNKIIETLSKDKNLLQNFSVRTGLIKLVWESGVSSQTMDVITQLSEGEQVDDIDLSSQSLVKIPETLKSFRKIKRLNLSNNYLTELPEWLKELNNLQELDVSRNQLSTLPKWFQQMASLQKLTLRRNRLSALPESLSSIIQVQMLDISDNQLEVLPEWLKNYKQLQNLDVSRNQIKNLPEWLGELKELRYFYVSHNRLTALPDSMRNLNKLESLSISTNQLKSLPEWLGELKELQSLSISANQIDKLPESFHSLVRLKHLDLSSNVLKDLPPTLGQLDDLGQIYLDENPLSFELFAAYNEGKDVLLRFLRARTEGQIILNEAKLILVGEGEVGKTCLTDALMGNKWQEHLSTHGIQIKSIKVKDEEGKEEITLNSWDFGGQRVYRPTHQLFFSAPAVYLVVWKPREGSQAGQVKEWIQLIKRRAPRAKIIVVATHGGPQQRQPDIDRQELWDLFGKDTVIDFFFVDNKPDVQGHRKGIAELKQTIARVAATLPEVGRSVPKSFADVRAAIQATGAPYLPFDEVLAICRAHNMDDEITRIFITISHRLGHLTHYENDPALRDIVILRPDWLATAMSYVLDDEETRNAHGLVDFSHLGHLWDDPTRPADTRYPATLHRIFLRLMERFDLSYRVAGLSKDEESNPVSLIAQLVPDTTPKEEDFTKAWAPDLASGDIQQTQICRIVDAANGQSANAEGLFYQLIVRLHKYSLGRKSYNDSLHWQRGLILDANYNGRALLRHIGNDVHITVRAAFPEYFLGMLSSEVKYLAESFWEGLRCDMMVPCIYPCGKNKPGTNFFEVEKLIAFKRKGLKQFPCTISGCEALQDIDQLLSNTPAAMEAISLDTLMREFAQVKDELDKFDDNTRRILSQVDKQYADLIQLFTDEAKEGPRLFSLFPLDGSKFNPKNWIRHQFRLVLWCEHSRLPLPVLNNGDMKKGVYDFELDKEWFKKTAPYLKLVTSTLSLVLPVASSALQVANDAATKALQDQIGLGKDVIDAIVGEGSALNEFSSVIDSTNLERGVGSRAENATLRELHALLKGEDPGFGGLVRVLNKRNEFLWVHEKFAGEY